MVWSTARRVTPGEGPVSIGAALAGTAVHILDDALAPVAPGEVCEIVIAGSSTARPSIADMTNVPTPCDGGATSPA